MSHIGVTKREEEVFRDLNDIRKRLHDLEINISKMNETTVVDTSTIVESIGGDSPPIAGGSSAFESIQFNTTPAVTPAEGLIWWNATDKTLNIKTDTDTIVQTGQEVVVRAINKTGAQIDNGTVVYINSADVPSDRPTITKADASTWEDSQKTIGLATSDIADDGEGFVTVTGLVRDVNTNGMIAGDRIYLSETAGAFTTTRPTGPVYIIELGVVVKVDASDGIVFVHVQNTDDHGFFNGTFVESFDLTTASDGAIITASLQRQGGGNLTMRFGDGFSTLVTAPMTKVLTAGTATVPQANYLYILQSDKTQMTLSTSGYPTNVDHIKIAKVVVLTAGITQNDDALANQNVNDHAADTILMGHLSHLGEWIRAQPASWVSGVAGNSATGDDYLDITAGPDAAYFVSVAGNIRQLHLQTYPARDNTDWVYVVNDPDAAYTRVTELIAGIDKLSTGVAWGNNKHAAFVFWGIQNKSGETSQLMCNLPSGQYNSQLGAENDVNGYTNVDIPDEFRSTGFLICKLVIQLSGATWTYKSTLDLRGTNPSIVTGAGGGSAIVSFPDNTFEIFDSDDPTKLINFQASGITAANTRIATMPDKDLTLIDTADAIDAVEAVANAAIATGDSVIFTDVTDGVLKQDLVSDLLVLAIAAIEAEATLNLNKVGIGREPATPLDVVDDGSGFRITRGTLDARLFSGNNGPAFFGCESNDDLHIRTNAATVATYTAAGDYGIGMTPTVQLELSKDEGQKPTTNTWTIAPSGLDFKQDIADYPLGLAELLQIRPRHFKYKPGYDLEKTHDMEKTHVGIIAEEIELVVPSTIGTGKRNYNFRVIDAGEKKADGNYRTIDTGEKDEEGKPIMVVEEFDTVDLKTYNSNDLTYIMINALKEIDTRLTQLEENK